MNARKGKRPGLWVVLSCKLPLSRLSLEGSAEAFKLWTVALCLAREEEGGGDVSPMSAARLAGVHPAAAQELVALGYWHKSGHDCPSCPDPGERRVQIHRYAEWQDTPEEIEERSSRMQTLALRRWESATDSGSQSAAHATRIPRANGTHAETMQNESESEKSSSSKNSTREANASAGDEFDEFWQAYPRKVGKGQARRAFVAARKKVELAPLLEALSAQHWSDPKFIPHPSTWLNGERWDDAAPSSPEKDLSDEDERMVREWLRLHPLRESDELIALSDSDPEAARAERRRLVGELQKRAVAAVRDGWA